MDKYSDLIGTRKAAKMLEVSQQTVRNWIDEGRLPGFVVPGKKKNWVRLNKKDVEEFLSHYYKSKIENQRSQTID